MYAVLWIWRRPTITWVRREELWEVLQRYGVLSDLLRAIGAMYQASEAV